MEMRRTATAQLLHTVVVVLLGVSGQLQVWSDADAWEPNAGVHAVLVAVITLPVLFCRRQPLLVAVVVSGASWLQYELGGELFQPWFASLLALYAVGAHAPLRHAAAGATAMGASVLAIDIPKLTRGDPVGEIVPAWFFLAGVWGFGRWMRRRQRETRALTERAEALEREHERQAQMAVAEERARIARELHDLVAHSMGVIVIQSQGAQRSLERNAEAAAAALKSIEATGRQGMAELRRLLGILTDVDSAGDRSPQPGLDQLPDLLDGVRGAGLHVEARLDGPARPLPAGVELAVYRIVQEALTNVLKHAQATKAEVTLHYREREIEVDIVDDGRGGAPASATGHGLVGMRERVNVYGGTLEVGPSGAGGFRVHAVVQVEAPPA
jgi:signal transduction histidine kinase